MVKHKNYVSYLWTPDWYARTPENADSLAFALLPNNRDTFMPGLPIDCIPPDKTMVASGGNATACVFFLNKVRFPIGCLATVTLIMNGALSSATRKLELVKSTVEQHAAKFGGPLVQRLLLEATSSISNSWIQSVFGDYCAIQRIMACDVEGASPFSDTCTMVKDKNQVGGFLSMC